MNTTHTGIYAKEWDNDHQVKYLELLHQMKARHYPLVRTIEPPTTNFHIIEELGGLLGVIALQDPYRSKSMTEIESRVITRLLAKFVNENQMYQQFVHDRFRQGKNKPTNAEWEIYLDNLIPDD